jgi:hypothetical protein
MFFDRQAELLQKKPSALSFHSIPSLVRNNAKEMHKCRNGRYPQKVKLENNTKMQLRLNGDLNTTEILIRTGSSSEPIIKNASSDQITYLLGLFILLSWITIITLLTRLVDFFNMTNAIQNNDFQ